MNNSVTRTKIVHPRRQRDFLTRPRLNQILDDLLDYRLTLIAAPAGYGKTSLLVDLASQVEYPVCWLSLDPLDHDFFRFIQYFVAAIEQVFPEFGGASWSLINNQAESGLDGQRVLRTIINDLYEHVEEHFALVLDDFHLIDSSPDVNQFINHFVQEMDENCHLVILSRSLLSLPDLPLMVGRTQVQGLSFEELAFHPEEVKDLYRIKYQQDMSDREAEKAVKDSEGWITGLLLSAETIGQGFIDHGRAARAAGIDLYDYLARQVLDQQSEELQDFMLRTSLMEEFNESLCQRALGEPQGELSWGELIQQLLHKNLFIQPVESDGTWLRYHHLFSDFLQQQYRKHYPGQAEDLLLKLIEVYRDQHWYEKAYAVCIQLDDDLVLANYIESVSPDLVHTGQVSLLTSWFDELTVPEIENNPALLSIKAALASMTGDPESGLRMLDKALDLISEKDDPVLYIRTLIRRAVCHRLLDSFQSGLDDALRARALTAEAGGGILLEAEAEREIGIIQYRLGLNQEAKEHFERSLSYYLDQGDQRNAAYVEMDLGFLEMNGGSYPAARSLYQQAYQVWEESGNLSELSGLYNNLGVLDHLTGDYLEAYEWFSRALDFARQTSNLRAKAFNLASLGDLALDLGALSRAEIYVNESKIIADEIGDNFLQIYLLLTMASMARRRGELKPAAQHLDAVQYRIKDYKSSTEMGRYHLERGLLLLAEDQPIRAQTEIQAALEVFYMNDLPMEICLAQIYLAWIDCLRGSPSDGQVRLITVQAIVQSMGTIHPLVPTLSAREDLFSNLVDQLPEDPLIRDLVPAVRDFQSRLPDLLERLGFNKLPGDTSQQPYLDISILGRVRVLRKGEIISVPEWTKQKTVRELFFYLLNQQEGASREEICLIFWPDSHPEQLKKQFKNALYRLRRAVGKDAILYHQPTRLYHFNRHLDYCYDVEEFKKALSQAKDENDLDLKIKALQRAADLYQHPFAPKLEGIWLEPVRYRLYLEYESSMLELAELQLSRDQSDASLETIEKLLLAVPSQEKAWRMAMRSYAANGDRSGIERTFQRCREALALDLDVDPAPETIALYHDLMA